MKNLAPNPISSSNTANILPLAALQSFLVIAEQGHMSRAALSLHTSVSALSHQMRKLQQRLRQSLFVRSGRGLRLSDAGLALQQQVAAPMQQLSIALRPMLAKDSEVRLRISTTAGFANAWLLPKLPDFIKQYPQYAISLDVDSALVDFSREHFDVAIRLGLGAWPKVQAEPLFGDQLILVAAPALLRQHGIKGSKLTAEAIAKLPLLGDPRANWKSWFDLAGLPVPKRARADFGDTESLNRAVLAGAGMAVTRKVFAQPLLDSKQLLQIHRHCQTDSFAYYLVYPERSAGLSCVQHFAAWLKAQI